jgi:hypothetical protein
MRRAGAFVLVVLALAGVSCNPREDAQVLRRTVTRSANLPRSFSVRVVGTDAAYLVDAKLEDDLRYAMLLKSVTGKPLVDYVVQDDAVAVRLRDPAFGAKLANILGDPIVDRMLKERKWVQDPSGAPPIVQPTTAGQESSGNPFQDARQLFIFMQTAIGQSQQIVKFSLEDISYKSRYDPWRYPDEEKGELRYDLRPPGLPHSEAQTISGRGGDIGPSHFRKLSAFVQRGRIDQLCEVIDIFGHEDYIALQQRGKGSNPFLASLFDRVLRGDTATVIHPRYMVVDVDYPETESVTVGPAAAPGKLTVFLAALQQAITAGALKPTSTADTSECRRTQSEDAEQPR